jgi:hypothetical protein
MRSFHQDRLGTNTGKALKKDYRCLAETLMYTTLAGWEATKDPSALQVTKADGTVSSAASNIAPCY